MSVHTRLLTVEEFWEIYANKPYELIRGEVVEVVPAGYSHGSIASRVGARLRLFVDEHHLGDVLAAETGFYLSETTLRGADAAFISNAKLATIKAPEKYVPFAPDLAVEVVSPNDTATEIQDKVNLYLLGGTSIVWVIYPDLRQVIVHRPDQTSNTVSLGGTLDGGNVLPGLKVSLSEIFPPAADKTDKADQ